MIETVYQYTQRHYNWPIKNSPAAINTLRMTGIEMTDFVDQRTEFICDCLYMAMTEMPNTQRLIKEYNQNPDNAKKPIETKVADEYTIKQTMAEHSLNTVIRIYASKNISTGYDLVKIAGLKTIITHFINDALKEADQT